ncbi:hypothetical protein C0993_004022 [Termitomyces sp. T159_Od127]|nr:hypothetical protein C0993_004022 [Termitomyces sp. T159_Od127]
MAAKQNVKRSGPPLLGSVKKRKVSSKSGAHSRPKTYPTKPKENRKEKLSDRAIIPIPNDNDEDDVNLSDQDLEVFEEYGGAASFLTSLDKKGISRSKKETERLHRLNKPVRQAINDDLPSVDSDGEVDDGSFNNSDSESLSSVDGESEDSDDKDTSDTEMSYEKAPRKHSHSRETEESRGIKGLPIKLPGGDVRPTGKVTFAPVIDSGEESSDSEEPSFQEPPQKIDDVSTGARFGRPAVIDVISNKSKASRIRAAKEQIAGICQEIVSDPENSLGLLRRLHTFSLSEIATPSHPDPVPNDPVIRKLSILSQLAVFKDIIPGYRIRALTDKEKAEKVSQMVAQTRDWEQGLVTTYQTYLRLLEEEIKARSDLADIALESICALLKEATHFNFRVNLMSCIVARLSKKSWDSSSELCLNTLIHVFREDLTGVASLEIVRLLNRMIKEKRFNVRPEVLSCLLHLRLKTELGIRASDSSVDKPVRKESGSKAAARRAKGKSTELPHLSKKAKNALKEKREIDQEFREAEAEVDKEERVATQTETLKLIFVLYFRILKNPQPTALLPAALHGISKFAHLVNIDFFKDLLAVLKELISRESDDDDTIDFTVTSANNIRHRLSCIVTAFELLSGQGTPIGEALNLDLSDFISALYSLILPLSLMMDIDSAPLPSGTGTSPIKTQSIGTTAPPGRSAAFAKRLLSASMHWPPAAAQRALDFVRDLTAKDPKLEALLSTKDRTFNGIYRPELDDPELSNPFGTSFWELHTLREKHWDAKIRAEADGFLSIARS